jgi:hypothetical protein
MRRLGTTLAGAMCAGVLALGFWGIASAEETAAAAAPAAAAPAAHQYVGAKKCKMCHNAEKAGAQFTKWTESKHAKAFETLASEAAKKIATDKGIADPQKAAECLSCHQTGNGVAAEHLAATYTAEGVTCESCHGAGADYIKMKTMQGIRDKSLKAEEYGLVMPTEETCKTCHNDKSPTFKSFDFAEYGKKIEHKIPEGYKRGGAAEEASK